ncbi:hypothetical protein [Salinisphaera sp. Q1T1-3]|uniref:hypothetical protein n=1 Tax=Salinisphaera sp. Q1T1-3 TaxID=2321229 RepID=UPI0013148CEA|nr:hypothetical protein [Salinisphaera sp. Q1T1-3]
MPDADDWRRFRNKNRRQNQLLENDFKKIAHAGGTHVARSSLNSRKHCLLTRFSP